MENANAESSELDAAPVFRPMRRAEQQTTQEEVAALLASSRRGALATIGDFGYPYAIPINFVYDAEANRIYFHCAKSGHKRDAVSKCDKVCFTVWSDGEKRDGEWFYRVESAVVFGRAEIVSDESTKLRVLRALAAKYYPSSVDVEETIKRHGSRAETIAVRIESMTGKRVCEK